MGKKWFNLNIVTEREIPEGAKGFAVRLLAADEAEGCYSRVARMAFRLSQRRTKNGISGSPDTDWKLAEKLVARRFAREVTRKLA